MSERLEDEILVICHLGRYINPRTFFTLSVQLTDRPARLTSTMCANSPDFLTAVVSAYFPLNQGVSHTPLRGVNTPQLSHNTPRLQGEMRDKGKGREGEREKERRREGTPKGCSKSWKIPCPELSPVDDVWECCSNSLVCRTTIPDTDHLKKSAIGNGEASSTTTSLTEGCDGARCIPLRASVHEAAILSTNFLYRDLAMFACNFHISWTVRYIWLKVITFMLWKCD